MSTSKRSQTTTNIPWTHLALGAAATCAAAASYIVWQKRAERPKDFAMPDEFHFFTGHLDLLKKNLHRIHDFRAEIIHELKGDIVAFSVPGNTPLLYINDPKLIKYVWEAHHEHLMRGGKYSRIKSQEMFGDGIFNTDRAGWKKQRKIASRLLTMRNLKFTMFENFKDVSDRMCTKIRQINSESANSQTTPIDLFDLFNRVTMDGFVTSAFGIESDSIESYPEDTRFANAFNRGMRLILERYYLRPFWKIEKLLDIGSERMLREDSTFLRELCDRVVEQNRALKEKDQCNRKCDLLSLFLESYAEADSRMIQDICLNFIIAGRDTTGTMLSWCVYELCLHPEIARKVRDEIDQLDEITYENVAAMSYTESVLLETLRIHPSVPSSNTMNVDKDIVLPDGRVIPKDYRVSINNYALGRAPWMYSDPLVFDPTRFSDGVKSFEPTHFPAFSVAPRMCLGRGVALMEAKVCLWYLMKNFTFELVPDQEVTYEMNVILVMKNGLKVFLQSRRD